MLTKNDFTFLLNVMLALQWFDQHAPFSDGLPIKKYHDGGELE